ncbi:MAG: hypothetical protein AB1630_04965 [bacterium]
MEIEKIKENYKDEWILLSKPVISEAKIKRGEVIFHSKKWIEVQRSLKNFKGDKALLYTGRIPDDVEVIL